VKRLAVLCSRNGSNFEAILAAIRRKKLRAEVAVMLSDNPKAFAVTRANRRGVPVAVVPSKLFKSRRDHEKLIVGILKNQRVDLVVLAGYMRLFSPYFIKAFRGRILNVHPSLLPAFKGAHAIRDAFQAGVRKTGVSVHVVTEALDAGPVIARAVVKRGPRETLKSLEKKIHRAEHKLYPAAIGAYLLKL
jgi:phosphoribosylglycinamide formyltransferase 1